MTRNGAVNLHVPGQIVRLAATPEWGDGQVQSVVGARVTVNFEHAGKQLINVAAVELDIVREAPRPDEW